MIHWAAEVVYEMVSNDVSYATMFNVFIMLFFFCFFLFIYFLFWVVAVAGMLAGNLKK